MRLRSPTQDPKKLTKAGAEAPPSSSPIPKKSVSRIVYLGLLVFGVTFGSHVLLRLGVVYKASGIVDSGSIMVRPELVGRITAVLVRQGTRVRKGDVLARVAVPGRDAAIGSATEQVRAFRAQIEAERDKARAKGDKQASDDLAEAARLTDAANEARVEIRAADPTILSLAGQIAQVEEILRSQKALNVLEVASSSSYLDLRLKQIAMSGQRQSLMQRRRALETRVEGLTAEALRRRHRAKRAPAEALAASEMAYYQAELDRAGSKLTRLLAARDQALVAVENGVIAWVQRRVGEIADPGTTIMLLVPDQSATIIAFPEEDLDGFQPGAITRIEGAGLEATGVVIEVTLADRTTPVTLLRPYEKEIVGPTVKIRIETIHRGFPRAGATVSITRPVAGFLSWLGF